MLDGFSVDITLEVLKIIRLYQNKRFSREEALDKLSQVEAIVMSAAPEGDLEEIVEILQLPKLVLFAGCRKYLEGGFDKDIKTLVKKGRDQIDKDMETALESAASIGAGVIDGATCCGKYMKDDRRTRHSLTSGSSNASAWRGNDLPEKLDESTGEDE